MIKTISSVIVVDDSIVQRHHAMLLLQDLGIEHVYEASSGIDALHLLSHLPSRPNLMIVDLEMPSMDGVQLLNELNKKYSDIPVIVLSSREESLLNSVETMVKSTKMNVLAVIPKPFTSKKMLAAMHAYERSQDPASAIVLASKPEEIHFTEEEILAEIRQQVVTAYYQPKVSMSTGMLVGVEALARLIHPTKGMISPEQFIPVAERHDLIHDLTLHMFEQVVIQEKEWRDKGLVLKVSVNLSAKSLEQVSVMQRILEIQEQYAVPPEKIILEITESTLVSDLGVALGILTSLRLKGFGLSIDDYGTGFSSMQQLSVIPFTELKIDKSFVQDADKKNQLQVLLKSAIDMAKQLHLSTVAEGIETEAEWFLLKEMGCDLAQGFLIGQPMSPDVFPQWLKSHHQRVEDYKKSQQEERKKQL